MQHPQWKPVGAIARVMLCAGLLVSSTAAVAQHPHDDSAPPKQDPDTTTFEEIVVVAPKPSAPFALELDPKAPRQPLPAHDGADLLRTVPGFSVIRKGGADGDPVFRSMAGSRVGIVVDGGAVYGGCGNRMDPPTAYVYPEAFDRVTVLKGPQSVAFGGGHSAAVVMFERETPQFADRPTKAFASLVAGNFDRHDVALDASAGTASWFVRTLATRSASGNYRDGDGRPVHSESLRWNTDLDLGWTPGEHSEVVVSVGRSDGEAAYADRAMDGVLFDRRHASLRGQIRQLGAATTSIEARLFFNDIDHVMDNFSLRRPPAAKMVSNPTRRTQGARVAATLAPSSTLELVVGSSWDTNIHTVRSTMNEELRPYRGLRRLEDARFTDLGVFAESTLGLGAQGALVGGVRVDQWRAHDRRELVGMGMMTFPNPTADLIREDQLWSGFLRWERSFEQLGTVAVGLGHSSRFPDYWELVAADRQAEDSRSAFSTSPERTTQLDLGLHHRRGAWLFAVSTFLAEHEDYILLDRTSVAKPGVVISRNVEARSWGGEASTAWRSGPWTVDASVALVHGWNRSDGVPLAQVAPPEGRLALTWDDATWSVAALLRHVAAQDRVDVGAGSIVGLDLGPSTRFSVLSVNGSWRARKTWLVAVGVDNLLDETYAEHISRAGAAVAGFFPTTRINEPGRTLWIRASFTR